MHIINIDANLVTVGEDTYVANQPIEIDAKAIKAVEEALGDRGTVTKYDGDEKTPATGDSVTGGQTPPNTGGKPTTDNS